MGWSSLIEWNCLGLAPYNWLRSVSQQFRGFPAILIAFRGGRQMAKHARVGPADTAAERPVNDVHRPAGPTVAARHAATARLTGPRIAGIAAAVVICLAVGAFMIVSGVNLSSADPAAAQAPVTSSSGKSTATSAASRAPAMTAQLAAAAAPSPTDRSAPADSHRPAADPDAGNGSRNHSAGHFAARLAFAGRLLRGDRTGEAGRDGQRCDAATGFGRSRRPTVCLGLGGSDAGSAHRRRQGCHRSRRRDRCADDSCRRARSTGSTCATGSPTSRSSVVRRRPAGRWPHSGR